MVKRIISFIIVVIVCVTGVIIKNVRKKENIIDKTNQIDIGKTNTITETIEDINNIKEESNIVKEDSNVETVKDNKTVNQSKTNVVNKSSNKKETTVKSESTQKTTSTQSNNKKTETQVNQKEQETQATIAKEEKPVEVAKEEYIYNNTETLRLINDINEIAKRNSSLWGEDGSKKYKIEKSSSLIGKNYMSPYNKSQLEGIVLNVFPVKFLVYAVDYKKTGFTTQTRYYIDIAEY